MPLKLRAPRPGKTPFYTIRGTYLGIRVEESAGTGRRSLAEQLRRAKERDIERGAVARPGEATFASAAINYMNAGGARQYLTPLLHHFGETALSAINQAAIDSAAGALYPDAGAPTRNRQVYTPVSAILKRAGIETKVRRPKGWRGQRLTTWLSREQAFAIFAAAAKIDAPADTRVEFAALLRVLCYTGMRLGDALGAVCNHVDLKARTLLLPITKNGKPRMAYLPRAAVKALRTLPRGLDRTDRVFRFHDGGRLRDMFAEACAIAGVTLPRRVAFHVFCHTYATWMRQHGGLDTFDLTKTDRWSDPSSADRYSHVVVSEIAKRAELLPVEKKRA